MMLEHHRWFIFYVHLFRPLLILYRRDRFIYFSGVRHLFYQYICQCLGCYLCCPIPTSTLAVCLEIHRHYRESFGEWRTGPNHSAMYLSQAVGRELLSPFGLFAVNAASNPRSIAASAANDNKPNQMKNFHHDLQFARVNMNRALIVSIISYYFQHHFVFLFNKRAYIL